MADATPRRQGDTPATPAPDPQQQREHPQGGTPATQEAGQQKSAPQKPGTRFTDWASI